MAPGDIWNFRAAFLTGATPIPVFLAQNGIDVWGIDYRWTFVPASVTDLSFMRTWGIDQDARDLGVAIGAARVTRALTGSGAGKIFLLGWSRGGQIGYAYVNGETQIPAALRQVKAFIPVDIYLKTDVPDLQSKACARQQASEAAIAAGTYAATSGELIKALGDEAVADPNGASAIFPGLTNHQAGLLLGEETFAFLGGLEPVPFYHFTGGTFDANGLPNGLTYSNEADLFQFASGAAPFQPNQELADADAFTCGQTHVPFADHLAADQGPDPLHRRRRRLRTVRPLHPEPARQHGRDDAHRQPEPGAAHRLRPRRHLPGDGRPHAGVAGDSGLGAGALRGRKISWPASSPGLAGPQVHGIIASWRNTSRTQRPRNRLNELLESLKRIGKSSTAS